MLFSGYGTRNTVYIILIHTRPFQLNQNNPNFSRSQWTWNPLYTNQCLLALWILAYYIISKQPEIILHFMYRSSASWKSVMQSHFRTSQSSMTLIQLPIIVVFFLASHWSIIKLYTSACVYKLQSANLTRSLTQVSAFESKYLLQYFAVEKCISISPTSIIVI